MFRFSNRNRSKKRKISFSPSKPEPSQNDRKPKLFENIRVYVHPHTVNSSRRRVVHELIQKNGGSFTLVPDSQTTHVLVDEGTLSRKPFNSRELKAFPSHINVLMIGWLSASVRANFCLDPAAYKIPCTYKSTSIAAHQGSGPQTTAFVEDSVSSIQLSTDSENNDINMIRFEHINEEVSTFDDGMYDQDTSCDDEWLAIPPVPSKTQNSSEPTDTYTFRSDFVFTGPKITKFIYNKKESDGEETSQSSSDLFDTSNSVVMRKKIEEYFSPKGTGTNVDINEVYPYNVSCSIATSVNESEKQAVFSDLPITSLESSSSQTTSQYQNVPAENIANEQLLYELALSKKIQSTIDSLLRAIDNVSRDPFDTTSENTVIIAGAKSPDDLTSTNNNRNVLNNEMAITSTESLPENALEPSQDGNILENTIQIVNVVTVGKDLESDEIKYSDLE